MYASGRTWGVGNSSDVSRRRRDAWAVAAEAMMALITVPAMRHRTAAPPTRD